MIYSKKTLSVSEKENGKRETDTDNGMDYKSRTQKKKEAIDLQKLGEALVKLSIDQLRAFNLPDDIREAVLFAKTVRSHGGLKRQMQFIGTLMRKTDAGPIQEALLEIEGGNYKKALKFRETEKWRDELIAGSKGLMEEIIEKHPGTDRQQLAQLIRNAVREKENNKPPRAHRELFRYLVKVRDT